MPKLFLSHSSSDDGLARAVAGCFEEQGGVEVVQMSTAIRSAEEWSERIRRSLAECDATLFLVTPNYVARPWFHIEWAAAWVQEKPPHLLLIDVGQDELPEVMSHRELTRIDENSGVLGNKLVAPLTGKSTVECQNLARDLKRLVESETSAWTEARWCRLTGTVADGVAVLPDSDLEWILRIGRTDAFVQLLDDTFAHPTLLHKVALFLIGRGLAEEAMPLGGRLHSSLQVEVFRHLIEAAPDAILVQMSSSIVDRMARRQCGLLASEAGRVDAAVQIADQTEAAYDRRVIAERLLADQHERDALAVIERADKDYEKAIFAKSCVAAGRGDLAVVVARSMTVNREIRGIAGDLLAADDLPNFYDVAACLSVNAEMRKLAIEASVAQQYDVAEAVARAMTVGAEIVRVAKELHTAGEIGRALRVVEGAALSSDRRAYVEYLAGWGDRAEVREAMMILSTSKEKGILCQALAHAGMEDLAVELAQTMADEEHQARLFWFATEWDYPALAGAAVAAIKDAPLRDKLSRVATAIATVGDA